MGPSSEERTCAAMIIGASPSVLDTAVVRDAMRPGRRPRLPRAGPCTKATIAAEWDVRDERPRMAVMPVRAADPSREMQPYVVSEVIDTGASSGRCLR